MTKAIPQERLGVNLKHKEVTSGEGGCVLYLISKEDSVTSLFLQIVRQHLSPHNPFSKITPRMQTCYIIHLSQTGHSIVVSILKSYNILQSQI